MPDFVGLGNGVINVVLLLVILVALVVIHEFGHFIVARRAGVTVHEFGIGFPPRARVLGRDKKGTIYTLNWLPIGGFVKLEGEEGRVGRSARLRSPAFAHTAAHPARRRDDEHPPGLCDLHADRRAV